MRATIEKSAEIPAAPKDVAITRADQEPLATSTEQATVSFSADGRRLRVIQDRQLVIYDTHTRRRLAEHTFPNPPEPRGIFHSQVQHPASSDDKRITVVMDDFIHVHDASNANVLASMQLPPNRVIVAESPDRVVVVDGREDYGGEPSVAGAISLVELETMKLTPLPKEWGNGGGYSMSEKGDRFAIVTAGPSSSDGTVFDIDSRASIAKVHNTQMGQGTSKVTSRPTERASSGATRGWIA